MASKVQGNSHALLCNFTLSFGKNYRRQNCPGPPGTPFDPSPFGSSKARPVGREEGNAVDPTTNIGKPYASQQHFAEIFHRYDLRNPWANQQRFTGFRGRNYRGQNCPRPPGTLIENYAPLATPLEAAREETSADYRPAYPLRTSDQRWELDNQLSHGRVIVLSPTSNLRRKIKDPLKRLAKFRETRTHCLCHFTLSFGRNYQCQNCTRPPDIPFDPSPFGSSKARPVEREEENAVDPTADIDKPYASQRHFAEIFRRYDLSKPWANQRHFSGLRGRNYPGQNCPGPPGTLTEKYAPLATPLEAAREATSADYRPTYTLSRSDQQWKLANQLSHGRTMILSPTSNHWKKTNNPLK